MVWGLPRPRAGLMRCGLRSDMSYLIAIARPNWFSWLTETSAMAIELTGVGVIAVGGLIVLVRYLVELASASGGRGAFGRLRRRLGRAILLGLEFLVAADIIATVLIDPTLRAVASLGLVVLIRTFLSWSLEVELEGRWPWQGQAVGASAKEKQPTAADAS